MTQPDPKPESLLVKLLKIAVESGADSIEVEPDRGEVIVYAFQGNSGVSIASFDSDDSEAEALLDDLWKRWRKRKRVEIDGTHYNLKVETYDSFDETVYRLHFEKI